MGVETDLAGNVFLPYLLGQFFWRGISVNKKKINVVLCYYVRLGSVV